MSSDSDSDDIGLIIKPQGVKRKANALDRELTALKRMITERKKKDKVLEERVAEVKEKESEIEEKKAVAKRDAVEEDSGCSLLEDTGAAQGSIFFPEDEILVCTNVENMSSLLDDITIPVSLGMTAKDLRNTLSGCHTRSLNLLSAWISKTEAHEIDRVTFTIFLEILSSPEKALGEIQLKTVKAAVEILGKNVQLCLNHEIFFKALERCGITMGQKTSKEEIKADSEPGELLCRVSAIEGLLLVMEEYFKTQEKPSAKDSLRLYTLLLKTRLDRWTHTLPVDELCSQILPYVDTKALPQAVLGITNRLESHLKILRVRDADVHPAWRTVCYCLLKRVVHKKTGDLSEVATVERVVETLNQDPHLQILLKSRSGLLNRFLESNRKDFPEFSDYESIDGAFGFPRSTLDRKFINHLYYLVVLSGYATCDFGENRTSDDFRKLHAIWRDLQGRVGVGSSSKFFIGRLFDALTVFSASHIKFQSSVSFLDSH